MTQASNVAYKGQRPRPKLVVEGVELESSEAKAFKDFWWDFVDDCGSFEKALDQIEILNYPYNQ